MALRRPAAAGPAGRRAPRVGAALRRPASRGAGEQSQKGEAEEKFVNGEEVKPIWLLWEDWCKVLLSSSLGSTDKKDVVFAAQCRASKCATWAM